MIGPQNFFHSLDQSNAKLTPILDTRVFPRFPAFSRVLPCFPALSRVFRALGELHFFVLSCYWLFRVFSFLLIGHCNFFWFWFTTQALYDSPASFGNYQLLMTLNWQNFYRTRRMFENLKLDDYTRTHIQVTVLNVCCCDIDTTCCCPLNSVCSQYIPLAPMSDQDRISPHNIRTISGRQVMRIEKNIN